MALWDVTAALQIVYERYTALIERYGKYQLCLSLIEFLILLITTMSACAPP